MHMNTNRLRRRPVTAAQRAERRPLESGLCGELLGPRPRRISVSSCRRWAGGFSPGRAVSHG
jgi:hypothetical protein